ncbi:MAG TPA: MFS transporter [Candidatus Acidoferrales bacterium]|jgi:MFS family permease|nr:MFS transporter [Candidatus Acidoferrales bacterium]
MVTKPTADQLRILLAATLRSLTVGMTGVLLAVYLGSINWDIRSAGLLVTTGLAGSAAATLFTSLLADRLGRRHTLVTLALLTALGAAALALVHRQGLLLVLSFFGMVNGLGRDRGPAYALEQALLPETTTPERRTYVLAWYGLALDGGLALGSLLASLPFVLRQRLGWTPDLAYRTTWLLSAALVFGSAAVSATLSSGIEVPTARAPRGGPLRLNVSPESRRRIAKLAVLTGMDSLGGGFLTSALVSFWFFRRFGLGEEWLGPLFFGARVANAASHLVAAWLARRIGLLNTMVFTHIPSSLFLMAVPFAPSVGWAAVFFLAREALVEMDVPTRQSYILAVVQPEERAFASGMTTLTRNIAYAAAPVGAGLAMSGVALASPLFLGAGTKIAYDLLLYFSFRRVKPPEERNTG